jgi:hypothetical protein
MNTDAVTNANIHAPDLGPTLPTYPLLEQIVRVYGGPIFGGPVVYYTAFTQQFIPPLGLRDREACYVFEANNVGLKPGYYDVRLEANYNGLPLYVLCCCLPTTVSSSSKVGG